MERRLATQVPVILSLIAILSAPTKAQDDKNSRLSLRGIDSVAVLIENLPDGAKAIGLTEEAIRSDVELKLRLLKLRVLPEQGNAKVPGRPFLYILANLTSKAEAASVRVELLQDAFLMRNNEKSSSVSTWSSTIVLSNPTAQSIRDEIKDLVDTFLNAWIVANQK